MTESPGENAKSLTELVALEIKLEMTRQDLRQSQLARTIGATEQWLSVRLRGKQAIDLNDLARIAGALGKQPHELLPQSVAANTLWNPPSAKRTRSAAVSSARPPRDAKRASTRPARMTPPASTRRPAMLPRPRPA